MRKFTENKIPQELQCDDVYDIYFIFDNEEEAVEYVLQNYSVDKEKLIKSLHEDDWIRDDFGKDNYLRSGRIEEYLYITELINGEYVLVEYY